MDLVEQVKSAWRAVEGTKPHGVVWFKQILESLVDPALAGAVQSGADILKVRGDTQSQKNMCDSVGAILSAAFDVQATSIPCGDHWYLVAPAAKDESRGGWATLDPVLGSVFTDDSARLVHQDDLKVRPEWAEFQADIWKAKDLKPVERISIDRVVATHEPAWGKWPDTADSDYEEILAKRRIDRYTDGHREITIRTREWPVFLSFYNAQPSEKPYRYPPHLDNSVWPSEHIMERQRQDLAILAKECKAIHWEHAYGCYPPVARGLRELFPLSVLYFADDAPGSSEYKTLPVAPHFDAYMHAMYLMDFNTGERVSDKYCGLGTGRCYFTASRTTNGLIEWCRATRYSLKRRVADLVENKFPFDMSFIGGFGGSNMRLRLLEDLNRSATFDIKAVLYGSGMRDGMILPRQPPGGDGPLVGPIYARSRLGLNPQWSSLYNLRIFDHWYMGIPQIMHDPWGELAAEGFEANKHYISFDGTYHGLLKTIKEWQDNTEGLIRIAVEGRVNADKYLKKKDQLMAQVFFDAWDKLI